MNKTTRSFERKPYEAPQVLDLWNLKACNLLVSLSLDATFNDFDEADEADF